MRPRTKDWRRRFERVEQRSFRAAVLAARRTRRGIARLASPSGRRRPNAVTCSPFVPTGRTAAAAPNASRSATHGFTSAVPHVRSRRLLRRFEEQARDEALSRDQPPDHHLARTRRGLELVLYRRTRHGDRVSDCVALGNLGMVYDGRARFVKLAITSRLRRSSPANWAIGTPYCAPCPSG